MRGLDHQKVYEKIKNDRYRKGVSRSRKSPLEPQNLDLGKSGVILKIVIIKKSDLIIKNWHLDLLKLPQKFKAPADHYHKNVIVKK